ncbi:hypothetical protein G2W53_006312 [Senna tora]|uniref:Uncharacterized protein n=1 Tax=Senna tora TaxID=362788 RepID=A0A834X4J6_9FABA|nr:hypothetical protein G2W53_006312 [Senna tora]
MDISKASFLTLKPGELLCFLYTTLGIISKTFSLILLTLALEIRLNTSKIFTPLNTTSSFGIHPARNPSNVDLRVGVSPGGCKQKLACNIGLMYLIGSCSQIPLEQSTMSQSFAYPPNEVKFPVVLFSHSIRILRRIFGVADIPPPPANIAKAKRRPPYGRVILQGLREIPSGPGHDQKMVMAHSAIPDSGLVVLKKVEQLEAVLGAGVDLWAVEIPQGVEASVVREIDAVGREGILGETWVLEHATMEDEFEGAEVVEERVFGAIGEEIEVEAWWEFAYVDPTVFAVHYCV